MSHQTEAPAALARAGTVIVTPVFEDAEAAAFLFRDLAAELGPGIFVVAVEDGSVRRPLGLDALEAAGLDGAILQLRRNVGHQRAIAAGLAYVAEHAAPEATVVVMDSDGEDRPATIPELTAALAEAEVDIAVATRKSRIETLRFKLFYVVYKALFALLTGRRIAFGNFVAMRAAMARRLASMSELPVHLAATVLNSKLRLRLVPIDRGPRYAGRTKMNFVGLVLHGTRAMMVFAEDVTVRVGVASVLVAIAAMLGAAAAIGLKLVGFSTPGWFSIAGGILFLIFLQTGALALMTLMLTGVVRGGGLGAGAAQPLELIDAVLTTRSKMATAMPLAEAGAA